MGITASLRVTVSLPTNCRLLNITDYFNCWTDKVLLNILGRGRLQSVNRLLNRKLHQSHMISLYGWHIWFNDNDSSLSHSETHFTFLPRHLVIFTGFNGTIAFHSSQWRPPHSPCCSHVTFPLLLHCVTWRDFDLASWRFPFWTSHGGVPKIRASGGILLLTQR